MGFDRSLPIKARILKRRRQRRRKALTILLSLFAVCTYLYIGSRELSNNNEALAENLRYTRIQQSSEQKHEDAIEIPDISGSENRNTVNSSMGIEKLKSELEQYISGFKGTYGVHYLNLYDGGQFGINDKEEYIAASTVKLPLNLYLYTRIADGSVKRDGFLTYRKEDYEEGTGEIRYAEFGKKYNIYELSRLSIVKSDNVATNMLFRFLEKQKVKNFMVASGGEVVNKEENLSCPRDMALYMKLAYDFYIKEKVWGGELMKYLENTEFNDRLPALLPPNIRVAHKTGNQVDAVHDIGIIYSQRPYVLSVMSKDINEDEANAVIANISKKVYDYIEGKQRK